MVLRLALFAIVLGAAQACRCTNEYNPVCGLLESGAYQLYDNECVAVCSNHGPSGKIAVDELVELVDLSECGDTGTYDDSCGCAEVYDPVCATGDDGTSHQFSNDCEATCAGYESYADGACSPAPAPSPAAEDSCGCTKQYAPVCVTDTDGTSRQFGNDCEAMCAGYESYADGQCLSAPAPSPAPICQCTREYSPVCVSSDGVGTTFSNMCLAECDGYTRHDTEDGECPGCDCSEMYQPVCVWGDRGTSTTFGNACLAECAGNSRDGMEEGECPGCFCAAMYDPVCVWDASGPTTFSNICSAECDGYTRDEMEAGECRECACAKIYRPVCGIPRGGAGEPLLYPNACEAECAGVEDMFETGSLPAGQSCGNERATDSRGSYSYSYSYAHDVSYSYDMDVGAVAGLASVAVGALAAAYW